jgi:four helix bundle protein
MEKPHKRLNVWKQAVELSLLIYQATEKFPCEERYSITDQMRRAATSIATNIAEGAARKSKREFARFLHMAQGSLSELDTQLEIVKRLGYVQEESWRMLDARMNEVDKMLSGLIRHQTSKGGVRSEE